LTVFRSSKGGEVIDGSLVVVSLTLRVIPAGTPKFVSAKTRNPNPTVSVTCAGDCCLRIGLLSLTSAASREHVLVYIAALPHVAAAIVLSHTCRVYGPSSLGVAAIVRLDEATQQHRPFQLTSSPSRAM
jgi:hypothetical protein